MKKWLDKYKGLIIVNKKTIFFLTALLVIGIITGSILVAILNESDKTLIADYFNNFLTNIEENKINYFEGLKNSLFNNLLYIILIWILGMSVIGFPIIIIMFFIKSFTLGFSISSIIFNYKLKGCLLSFVNIFPHQILNFIVYMMLTTYSLFFSLKIINAIFKKKEINFKNIMNKYLKVLLVSVIIIIISILIENFITPILIKMILPFIK